MQEPSYIGGRKIIHIDMDAFYASVEQRDNPDLRGKPIAVGGGSKRGVTTTASYEARQYGVRSAMPGWKAKQLCPQLIFVKPRFDAYKAVSHEVRSIFADYTDLIEPLSLDEAYLDVTNNKKGNPIATEIALEIKQRIQAETGLTASAGVSYCKFIAKIASDINKPNGIAVIRPHEAKAFLHNLEIHKFFGVGKVTATKMNDLGIHTGADLASWNKVDLMRHFGKSGAFYFDIVRGKDDRPVRPNRIRKSLAVERTMTDDLTDIDQVREAVTQLIPTLLERILRSKYFGKTLTLKLKNKDFQIRTRSISVTQPIDKKEVITTLAHKLINENQDLCKNLRLIGLTVSNALQTRADNSEIDLFTPRQDLD